MIKHYKYDEKRTKEIEEVLLHYQIYLIKKGQLPNIMDMKETSFKYYLDLKRKRLDFIVFQYFDNIQELAGDTYPSLTGDQIVMSANYFMRMNTEFQNKKDNCIICFDTNNYFGRLCLQTTTLDFFCICQITN